MKTHAHTHTNAPTQTHTHQEKRGYKLKGAKLALGGNVPQGGGLSSSAALEVSVATALNHMNNLGVGPKDLVPKET